MRKDDSAKEKYGEAGKNGVIEITLKKGDANEQKPVPDIYIDGKKVSIKNTAVKHFRLVKYNTVFLNTLRAVISLVCAN